MSFPKYPEYKETGIEWLGRIPAHWATERFKASVASCRNGIWGGEPMGNEDDVICVRVADFDRSKLIVDLHDPTIRNVPQKDRQGRVLSRGNLLIEKSGGGEHQPVGTVVLYERPEPAVCSNFVARIELAPGQNASFWRYQHAAAYSVRLNTRSIKQTSGIQNLDQSQYFDEVGVFPPKPEQDAIASFLDLETARLDDLIAQQQRLIELLKEKRQAVISHAVTKGLDPDAPMKPSGIEFLGDIPRHWEVVRFSRCVGIAQGQVDPADDGYSGFPLIAPNHVESGTGVVLEMESAAVQQAQSGKYLCRAGDVIYSKIRPGLRKACIAPVECLCSADMYPLRAQAGLSNEYLLWQLLSDSFTAYAVNESQRVAMPKINRDALGAYRLAIPPCSEQLAIDRYLREHTEHIDSVISEVRDAMELLRERRAALISAAVTGQIDVRGLAERAAA